MEIVEVVGGTLLTIAVVLGLLAIPWLVVRSLVRGIDAGVSKALRGRIGDSRRTRILAACVGVLSLACGLLVLPALIWFGAHWNNMRAPSDLARTGYRLPQLDPMDAVNFSLYWAGAAVVLAIVTIALGPSGFGSRMGRSGIAAAVVGAAMSLLIGPFNTPHEAAIKAICLSNVKSIALGLQMYATDNDDMLPSAEVWCDQLAGYVKGFS